MANISFVLIAEDVISHPDGKPKIINPLPMIVPVGIPSNFSFYISVGLYDIKSEESINIKIQLINPEKNIEFDFDIPLDGEKLESEYVIGSTVLNLNCKNVELRFEGNYEVSVQLNAEEVKKLIVPVIKKIH